MLRVSFSSATKARAAVDALAAYGYPAERSGRHVVTDCPPLLAIPAIQRQVGFAEIERLDLKGRIDSLDSAAGFGEAPRMERVERGGQLRA